ncbi:MAG: putative selenate ABC transporter substrate-binding protein [Planctomycetota bacterium]
MKTFLTALLIGAALSVSSCSSSEATETKTLRFSAIPAQDQKDLIQQFQPVADYLSKELGVPVEYVPAADYTASVEMFKNGQIQLAWFGGLTGVQARRAVEGARALAFGVDDPKYKSYFIANPAAGVEPSDAFPMGLEGKSFTFGSATSTSGRLMPEHFIRKATGKSPAEFFDQENKYSGSHDKTWEMVQSGAVMAGAIDFKTYDRDLAAKKIDPEKCMVIWITPEYPDYSWNASPEVTEILGKDGFEKLQRALLAMKDPKLLEAINRPEGLVEAKNSDFEPLVKLAEDLGLVR